jgi:pimeloyl-ACP methyl ester carboxylesterase
MHITVNGVRLFFDVIGEKLVPDGNRMTERPTVLLLHGGPGFDHSMFKPAFAPLADVAQLVLLDHRGNGRSDRGDPALWTLDQWGDDVGAFCDALGIVRPFVLGYSFGGFVAQSYAIRHPDHPAKLILYSTAPVLLDGPVLDAFRAIGGAEARSIAARYFAARTETTTAEFRRVCFPLYNQVPQDTVWMERTVGNINVSIHFFEGEGKTFDYRPLLHHIQCPTLVVGGGKDPRCPPMLTRMLADGIRADLLRLVMFEACGHGPHIEDPDHVIAVLRDFISESDWRSPAPRAW